MKLRTKFVLLFGVAGCAAALTLAAVIPQHTGSKVGVENFTETKNATMLSLRQQAASALMTLQGASDKRP